MTDTEHRLKTDLRDGVLTLVLDRPARHNALDQAGYEAFAAALEAARTPDVRVIVIAAEGPTFCAGNDREHFRTRWPQGPDDEVVRFLIALSRIEVPIVAAVQGAAVGIGATLLLHCDLVVMGEAAFLAYPFLSLGLAPEGGSSRLLRERIGPQRTMELLLSARRIDADEACRLGLATHRVQTEAVRPTADGLARGVAALSVLSVRTARARVLRHDADALEDLIRAEIQDVNTTLAAAGA
jgi:enoyl-CoA hydratase/carnithine racemase